MASSVFFDIQGVTNGMNNLESMFTQFSDELKAINSYIETIVNVGPDSAIFGEYGSKLLQIWSANASTFGDFHANFESWSEAVAVISSNNEKFEVDTAALYRDSGNSLNGVQDARKYLSEGGDSKSLSKDAKAVLNSASREKTQTYETNIYGGKTVTYQDKDGRTIKLYYDSNGAYVGKEITTNGTTKVYDAYNKEINKMPTADKYKEELKNRNKKLAGDIKEANENMAAKYAKASEYKNPYGLTGSHLDFINSIKDGAVAAYNEYGVLPSLTLAQAILETGWGKSKIGNNIFGIKAGSGWTGKRKNCLTSEQNADGSYVQIYADFRDYDSIEDSIIDHAKLLTNDRYKPVIASKNYKEACTTVRECGYATSLDYSKNLISLVEQYGLDQWDPK